MIDMIVAFIRKIAEAVSKAELKEVKIFFSAANPENISSRTKFDWLTYQVLFLFKPSGREAKYYIYSTELEPYGKERGPNKVFESNETWSGANKDIPTPDVRPGEFKRAFPKILRFPKLFPTKSEAKTIYVNTSKDDIQEYSSDKFKEKFDNSFYIVSNIKTKELKNPFGKLLGRSIPEKKETEGPEKGPKTEEPEMEEKKSEYEVYSYVVRSAMKKDKQKPARGFDIVQDIFKHPTEIRTKESLDPLETNPLRPTNAGLK